VIGGLEHNRRGPDRPRVGELSPLAHDLEQAQRALVGQVAVERKDRALAARAERLSPEP
jgi:hypothetical protein